MSRCVSVLVSVVFSIALGTSAHAQAPARWNGPYIGVNLGHGSADIGGSVVVNQAGPFGHSVDADGAFGGIQVGFNRRVGNFFVGLEADLQTADISGSSSFGSSAFTYSASASIDWFGTARARAGYATDAMLLYVTGGLAFGGVNYDATYKTTGPGGTTTQLQSNESHVGFVLGAGVELALRSNWSLKLEYQYLNFGDQGAAGTFTSIIDRYCAPSIITTNTVTTDFDTDIHTVRIGLNYAFHGVQPRHQPLKP